MNITKITVIPEAMLNAVTKTAGAVALVASSALIGILTADGGRYFRRSLTKKQATCAQITSSLVTLYLLKKNIQNYQSPSSLDLLSLASFLGFSYGLLKRSPNSLQLQVGTKGHFRSLAAERVVIAQEQEQLQQQQEDIARNRQELQQEQQQLGREYRSIEAEKRQVRAQQSTLDALKITEQEARSQRLQEFARTIPAKNIAYKLWSKEKKETCSANFTPKETINHSGL